jgi:serine/threonine-protein kinase
MARDLAEVVDFGRYEPLFRIGLGGMAEVYAARIRGEAGFQKLVAVKRMLPHLTGDKKFVDMFLDEARLAANISSPHVVQTLDLGRADDDSLYIVMDLILGVTISQMLRHLAEKKQYVDSGIAIELITQAAQGLDDAHEAVAPNGQPLSLVHRDISPQNILIGTDGRARVTDFGIAHAIMLRRTETQVGEMKGKFAYFSPEQALGKGLDRRSDIFALGIVAWELVTGRRLFRGTPLEQLEAVKRCEIPPPAEVRPDLPKELSDAIMQALARDPEDRYASAAALSASLRRAGATIGDIPNPRVIGRFVKEVGGNRLERMRQCIANSGKLPADVPKVTAIIEGTISGTHFIAESTEETHILDDDSIDEVSEIVRTGASRDFKDTAEGKLPKTQEVLMSFGSQVTTDELPDDPENIGELPTQAPLIAPPTTIDERIADAPTVVKPDEASLTIPDPSAEISEIHQAPTRQWMESAQPTTDAGPSKGSLAMILGGVLGLAALLMVGLVLLTSDDSEEVDGTSSTEIAYPPPTSETDTETATDTDTVAETETDTATDTDTVAETETDTETAAATDTAAETATAAQTESTMASTQSAAATAAERRRREAAIRARRERERRERERRERERRERERQQSGMMTAPMNMSGIPVF